MLITLTTDFGASAYVAAMKGAALAIAPDVRIVDVAHGVPAHDVMAGALAMLSACPFFPEGSIHVGVVDPGVGTARRAILVESRAGLLVGPDNGLLVPLAERLGFERARVLENRTLWRVPEPAPTFHGRDIFAPVAAHLARGLPPAEVGPEVKDVARLDFGRVDVTPEGLVGRVLAIDSFGSIVTNVPVEMSPFSFGDRVALVLAERAPLVVPFARTYGEVVEGEALLLAGSHGLLEIAVNRGRAAALFGARPRDAVTLERVTGD